MFRAVVQAAHHAASGRVLERDAESQAALELRRACVQELSKRREEMEPFMVGIVEGCADFDEYLRLMATPGAWGGEPEMLMASHVLTRPITVFRTQEGALEPIVTYNEGLAGGKAPALNVLWSGAHYDSLLPM